MSRRAMVVEGLADRYYARVLAFARQLTDQATAEDVTQEVFARLMSVEGLEDRTISISYLLKAAHNMVRGLHRKQVRAQRCLDRLAHLPGDRSVVAERKPVAEGSAAVLERRFARLAPHERDTLRFTVCEELSLKDASRAMGVRVTTLTNWKYRALRKLSEGAPAA
jgi:RNA polymerase sigma factor (sigma-70 family)